MKLRPIRQLGLLMALALCALSSAAAPASGTISTTGDAVTLTIPSASINTVAVDVRTSGGIFTITPQLTIDGTNWFTVGGTVYGGTSTISSITASGSWTFPCAGGLQFRAYGTSVSSGSATVTIAPGVAAPATQPSSSATAIGAFRLASPADGAVNSIVSTRPYPEQITFLRWGEDLADGENALANGTATAHCYVDSASGNDANDGTDTSHPVKTLVRAQALYNARTQSGIFEIDLIRGGVWNGNTTATGGTGATESSPKGLTIGNLYNNEKAIIRDYGAAGSPPPRLTTFNSIPAVSWSAAGGGHASLWKATIANTVGWVRPVGSIGGTDVMVKIDGSGTLATNLTAMDSVAGSWYWDSGTTTLYIHPFASQDPTVGALYEYTTSNTTEGISLGDSTETLNPAWVRVENVTVEGYGCQGTYNTDNTHALYGIHSFLRSNSVAAVVRCTVVYNNRHNIGATNASTGGILLIDNSIFGCCTGDGNGPAVGYASQGGQAIIVRDSLISGGVLYRQSRKDRGGCGIYAHTSSSTYKTGLELGIRNRNLTGQCQIDNIQSADYTMLPTFSTSADCVSFSIGHSFRMREPTTFDASNPYGTAGWDAEIFPAARTMFINCSARVCYPTGVPSYGMCLDSRALGFGVMYNCDFEIDGKINPGPNTAYSTGFKPSIYNDDQKAYLWNCRIHVENANSSRFTIFQPYGNGTTAGAELRSSIVSCNPSYQSNGAHACVAINNNTANLKGNAYYGLGERTDSIMGYSNDASLIELAHCPQPGRVEPDSPLLRAILSTDMPWGRRLEYDKDGRSRSLTTTAIGPWESQ